MPFLTLLVTHIRKCFVILWSSGTTGHPEIILTDGISPEISGWTVNCYEIESD